ncbi:glutamyl-tRNA reductase [Neptunicella sp. SCSIO 80796]|uniref:glutamyl-tRNA reductase n=1 Tax=Neptunicella plasticusilytica TaxID=3117012 RepID=UPI003A4E67B1
MSLIVLGINHKTAPVEIREKVSFSTEQLIEAYRSLHQSTGCLESVILSTCNRTEIYCYTEQQADNLLVQWLAEYHQLDVEQLNNVSYLHQEQQAITHVMRVASGLDSMVLGEPQVLGQLKQAFSSAKNTGNVGSNFERLFQQSFSIAKKVRSDTDIGANSVSVAYSAVQLAKHIFGSLQHSHVLLIGAGETIELVGRHLKEQQVSRITVANRTISRGKEVAEPLQADVITLAQVPNYLSGADIVITSTASQLPILGKGVVERALRDRRQKPMFMVDLAVPRDIEPEVSELNDAYLYSVDDLQQIIEQNMANRQEAAAEAEKMIAQQVEHYMQWNRSLDSIDVLREYREQSEQIKKKLQERALNQLLDGQSPEQIILELANKLTNSLIHAPTKAIKQAAEQADHQGVSKIRGILGLDTD